MVADRLTIVSVTPNALRSDSRTLKEAATLAREGHRSIVVERYASGVDYSSLGIEVISLLPALPDTTRRVPPVRPFWWRFANRLREGILRRPYDLKLFADFMIRRWRDDLWPATRIMPRADLYILHSFHWLWPVRLRCALHRVPYIYDAHDFYRGMTRPEDIDRWAREWLLPFYARSDRAALAHAAAAMTATTGCADLFERSDGIRPLVLRNVHDARLDRAPPLTLRAQLGLSPDDFLLVSTGNAKPGMKLEGLLPHVGRLPREVHLAFVGAGYDTLGPLKVDAIRTGRVHFIEAVPAETIVPFIADSDAALIAINNYAPNYRESLPNRLFQALAADLPVLHAPIPEIMRLSNAYGFGIAIATDTINGILEGVTRLRTDPQLYQRLKAGSHMARDALSWAREEVAFVNLVSAVANRQDSKALSTEEQGLRPR
jgi:glycosyltransferase involved in cell wall biosynthesis